MKAFGLAVVVGATGWLALAGAYWFSDVTRDEVVGANLGAGAIFLLGSALVLAGMGIAAYGAFTGSGSRLGSALALIAIPAFAVLIYRVGVSGFVESDPLVEIESSGGVDAAQQQVCAEANPELLKGVEVIATAEAPFHEVKAAMVRRFGQAEADAAVIEVGDDVMVTLCALDVSNLSTTPQVGRAVMAVANGSSWWASTSLR